MLDWLTPNAAVFMMLIGVIPSAMTIGLLYDDRHVPGVIWFLISMGTGAAWAFFFALMTFIDSPTITLALANIFWTLVPIAAVSLFLLAYEFVFKTTVSRYYTVLLFAPIGIFFVLSWVNPGNIIYTVEYTVSPDGFLSFPQIGGIGRLLVTQVYGYLLVFFAAGMFIGEAMRTDGVHRKQTLYLLLVFSTLVVSTVIKVSGFLPIYYDLTSTVYGLSGLLFAYSIDQHGFLRSIPTARSQTFNEVGDGIIVVNDNGRIIDANDAAEKIFSANLIGTQANMILPEYGTENGLSSQLELTANDEVHHFAVQQSSVDYGRDLVGTTITLSDVTQLKTQERELELLKQILSRMFRHNIRNDLTVINGYLQQVRDRASDDIVKIAEDITAITGHIEAQTKKAGKIEHIITNNNRLQKPIGEFIQPQDFALIPGYDNTTMNIDIGDDVVEAHSGLHLAIQEIVENAIEHNDTDRSTTIDIYTESANSDSLFLVVEDNGPGIPTQEIDALENKEETSLSHVTGIGLWLVHWIVDYSNGELVIETTESGTLIKIRLHRVNRATTQ